MNVTEHVCSSCWGKFYHNRTKSYDVFCPKCFSTYVTPFYDEQDNKNWSANKNYAQNIVRDLDFASGG